MMHSNDRFLSICADRDSAPVVSQKTIPEPAGEKPSDAAQPATGAEIRRAHPLVFVFEDNKRALEQYRIIRTRLLRHPDQPRVIGVCSADPGDGKTLTSINVAAMLSLKDNTRVLLVDCDIRRSRIGTMLQVSRTAGLTHVLAGRATLQEAIAGVPGYPQLDVLTAGQSGDEHAELLDSNAWTALIEQARAAYRVVLIDTAPLSGTFDAHLIMNALDGIVLVVRPDHTNRRRCLSALKSLPQNRLLGVIVNGVEDWFLRKVPDTYY